ncbi:MAG: CheY-like chemotaxis protein [Loktanella salsilacus]|uniref:response regulator n=1 Tax=Loktanella salsilacus TaxID=195913 RepID=UPI003989B53B
MKVLIVEDDSYKRDAVAAFIRRKYTSVDVEFRKSVQSAVECVTNEDFDFVVLDMSLPSHDLESGGALSIPRLSGGVEVLFELNYLKKTPKVIILTQYPEVEMSNELVPLLDVREFVAENYGVNIVDCVYFDFERSEWQDQLDQGMS